jgi:O-antigen ligase
VEPTGNRPRYWGRRALAVLAAAAIVAYPVRGALVLDGLPLAVRLAWPAAVALALAWPRASLLAFAAAAPLLPVVPALEGWPPVSLPGLWLYALIVAAALAQLRRPHPPVLPRAAVLLLLVASASLVVALAPLHLGREVTGLVLELHDFLRTSFVVTMSQRELFASVVAWSVMAEGVALLWLVLATGRERPVRDASRLAAAASAGAVAAALWGMWQWWTGRNLLPFWVEQDPFITRINGPFTDVNAFGAYLASMAPLVVAAAWSCPSRPLRAAGLAGALAVVAAAGFTASRAAWGALALGMVALALGAASRAAASRDEASARRWRRRLTLATAGALAALASLSVYATARNVRFADQRSYLDTLLYTLNVHTPLEERLKGRGELWAAGWRMVRARPLDGIGIGRYFKEVYAYAPNPRRLIRPQENAHNYPLQVAAELGVPGLICLLALVAAAAAGGWRAARRGATPAVRRLGLAAAAGIGAFFLTCLTGHSLLIREGQLTFWVLAGVGLLLGRGHGPPATGARAPADRATPGTRLARLGAASIVPASAAILLLTLPLRVQSQLARIDLSRLPSGVYDEERSRAGDPFRWTEPKAVFHIPAGARTVQFTLRAAAPFPQTLRVVHDGRVVEIVRFDDHHWRTLRYVLPQAREGVRFRRFELHVTPAWRPADDPRDLGVMVRSVEWRF